MPLNLTWVDLAFSGTKGYPSQVKRHSLPFQEEAVLKYLVVPLTFALDCTYVQVLVQLYMANTCRRVFGKPDDQECRLYVCVSVCSPHMSRHLPSGSGMTQTCCRRRLCR